MIDNTVLDNLALLQIVLDYLPVSVMLTDAKTQHVTYINRAGIHFRGITELPLSNMPIAQLENSWLSFDKHGRALKWEDLPSVKALLRGEITDNEEFIYELDNGQRKHTLTSAVPIRANSGEITASISVWVDITEYQNHQKALAKARDEIRILRGILPICSSCKKIRDDAGAWNQIETYIRHHSEAEFSHSICPECTQKLYPDADID